MDEEAIEKIAKSLDAVGEMLAGKHLDNMTREALAQLTLRDLEQLGYHKLPKLKPPLLSKEKQGKVRAGIPGTANVIDFAREVSKRTAQAQRRADIKFYEG